MTEQGHVLYEHLGVKLNYKAIIACCNMFNETIAIEDCRVGTLIQRPLLSGLVSLAIIDSGVCVPLSSQSTDDELAELFEQLDLDYLIVDKITAQTRTNLFDNLGCSIWVVDFKSQSLKMQQWQKSCSHEEKHDAAREVQPPVDHALILLTSGSTGKPKQVGLSLANINHAIDAVQQSLELSATDKTINMLPMHHVGGFLDLFLAPLLAGGAVCFFDAKKLPEFPKIISDEKLTWIQGSPAILASVIKYLAPLTPSCLRFIRSVSAPLSDALYDKIEQALGIPVIEIYGMSESTGVITSNPFPPQERKRGSVGLPVDCELSIRNESAYQGSAGEIWIKSNRVFSGYSHHLLNDAEWEDQWFNTGDLGYMDAQGYVFLTGRSKEQINRGGQKVSPREIDIIVENWPEVKEAVAYSFKHQTLGEEVGLVICLQAEACLSNEEVQQRLSTQLASFKRPKKINFLKELPRNLNGKVQRHMINQIVEKASIESSEHKMTDTQRAIKHLFSKALGIDVAYLDKDFFELGGDSLSAVELITSIEKKYRVSLADFSFHNGATVKYISDYIDQLSKGRSSSKSKKKIVDLPPKIASKLRQAVSTWQAYPSFSGSYSVQIQEQLDSDKPILFWCGNGFSDLRVISQATSDFYQVVCFRSLSFIQKRRHRDMSLLSQVYADEILKIQPEGPYHMGGFCAGGEILYEVAKKIAEKGHHIKHLIFNDFTPDCLFNTHTSLTMFKDWTHNPLNQHANINEAWNKMSQGKYAVLELEGNHLTHWDDKRIKELSIFLQKQRKAIDSQSEAYRSPYITHQNHADFAKLNYSPLSPFLTSSKEYLIDVEITNQGDQLISSEDNYALHARWLRAKEKLNFEQPMYTPLVESLPSGKSMKLPLRVTAPSKQHHPYRLEVALLQEGRLWESTEKNKVAKWHLII